MDIKVTPDFTITLTDAQVESMQAEIYRVLPQILFETPQWRRVRRNMDRMSRDGVHPKRIEWYRCSEARKLILAALGRED